MLSAGPRKTGKTEKEGEKRTNKLQANMLLEEKIS